MGIVPNHDQIILINKKKPAVQGGGPWLCVGYVLVMFVIICVVSVVSLQVAINQQKATIWAP